MIFTPEIRGGATQYTWDEETIRNETMLFHADPQWAIDNGGPITQAILWGRDFTAPSDMHYVVDTRVTMLKPGMIPAIPGYHCDNFPRDSFGLKPLMDSRQFVVVMFIGPAPTEVLVETVKAEVTSWGDINEQVRDKLAVKLKPGVAYRLGPTTLHRATPAEESGWRYFIRLALQHKPPRNEIRKQVQVYTTEGGW